MKAFMNYGAVLGLLLIINSLFTWVIGLEYDSTLNSVLAWSITIAGLAYFMIRYRNVDSNGYISYGDSFKSGFMIVLFACILSGFYSWIFMSYLEPGLIDTIQEKTYESYIESGMSEDEAVRNMEMASSFMTPGVMTIMATFFYVFFSAIIAAVIALFVKRENPNPFADTE